MNVTVIVHDVVLLALVAIIARRSQRSPRDGRDGRDGSDAPAPANVDELAGRRRSTNGEGQNEHR